MSSAKAEVCHEGVVIPYTLRRSKRRRKTLQISVGSDGVRVAVPFRTPNKQVQELVLNRAPWILKQLDKQKERPVPKKFATGETMPYLGREVYLSVTKQDVDAARVRFHQWRFFVDAPKALKGDALREAIRLALLQWYVPRAGERITAAVKLWWPIMKEGNKPQIIIGNQKTLWGSCAADGTLPVQLAAGHDAALAYGVRGGPRVGPPQGTQPLRGLLEGGQPGLARRHSAPPRTTGSRSLPASLNSPTPSDRLDRTARRLSFVRS